ncbi:MAG: metallophosphoesterase [Clostridia bacterium]|nr:metallophosphoesterase [Clostridia bacterium]
MAIYVTGDTHANQVLWDAYISPILQDGDILIVAGDFGVGFWNGRYWSEETFYDYLAQQPYTVAFCDGNHENFDKLNAYPISKWNGGQTHKIRPNVIHLMRGESFILEDKTLFAFGGGYSFDYARRAEGYDWWAQEMPSQEEYQRAYENLEKHAWQVDYILTHTCPAETIAYMNTMRLGTKKIADGERELNLFLDYIRSQTTYQKWYFGHFHCDKELRRNQYVLLDAVRDLHTGEIIQFRIK